MDRWDALVLAIIGIAAMVLVKSGHAADAKDVLVAILTYLAGRNGGAMIRAATQAPPSPPKDP